MMRSEWRREHLLPDHEHLAREVWGQSWSLHDAEISEADANWLASACERLDSGEPLAYILGYTPFYGCDIAVCPDVLIPRPATEQMVDRICSQFKDQSLKVLDLCTGSGCIAIALKKARPDWQVSAVDVSEAALAVAAQNAERNQVSISWQLWDITTEPPPSLACEWDVIVSNPPYVSWHEYLPEPSLRYEPLLALVPEGERATVLYDVIARFAAQFLSQKGELWVEHGHTQREEVIHIHKIFGLCHKACYADYQGHDRIVVCTC